MNIAGKGELGPEVGVRIGLVVFPVDQFEPDVIPRLPGGVDVHLKVRGTRIIQNIWGNVKGQVSDIGIRWVTVNAGVALTTNIILVAAPNFYFNDQFLRVRVLVGFCSPVIIDPSTLLSTFRISTVLVEEFNFAISNPIIGRAIDYLIHF